MSRLLGETPFLELLPQSIRHDAKVRAAATALDEQIAAVQRLVPQTLIYSRLDDLPEAVVELLGWQLHVDFWDPSWPLEHKLELVRGSIAAHRHKGTPWAVETVLAAIGLNARVREWFEYQGEPYRFILEVGVSDRPITPELRNQIKQLTHHYKNVRSWPDFILVHYEVATPLGLAAGAAGALEAVAVQALLLSLGAATGWGVGGGCVAGVDHTAVQLLDCTQAAAGDVGSGWACLAGVETTAVTQSHGGVA